ncbi:MAG: hypothetical protein ACI4PE_03405 [Bacilli bacterium]
MGYRSEVAIAMKKSDYEELVERAKINNRQDVIDLIDYGEVRNPSDNVVILYWDWVKWYQDNEDVQYIENYLIEIQENGKPYSFVRLGEELSDIEERKVFGESGDDYSCDIIHYYRGIDMD